MGFYREQILPRLTDRAFRGEEAARARARATAGLSGEVLEVGFGSGLTMPFYPPAVTRVRAVEPSAVARKLAAGKVAASAVPVDYVGADAQALPLEDATVDHVVSIMTLCSIPDAQRALAESCVATASAKIVESTTRRRLRSTPVCAITVLTASLMRCGRFEAASRRRQYTSVEGSNPR